MIQTALTSLLLLAIGYLLGAIPSGYLAGRWLKGIDLRECGSGSTGATNVLRNVGKGPALAVFLIDVGKGALAVLLAKSVGLSDWLQVLAGLAALAGHIWPVWLGWKGGKAVATGGCSWMLSAEIWAEARGDQRWGDQKLDGRRAFCGETKATLKTSQSRCHRAWARRACRCNESD